MRLFGYSVVLGDLIYAHKKAWTKLCVSVFEVFDYLSIKYTSKAHAIWRERSSLYS